MGYCGSLALKSGLAILHQLHVGAGVIDPDYTREIMVLMTIAPSRVYSIRKGDPVAQLTLEKVSIPILREVKGLPPTIGVAHGCGF